jgi:DNA repair protein RadC
MSTKSLTVNPLLVKELPAELKPSERARTYGVYSLNNVELLQLVYGFKDYNTPAALLKEAGSLAGIVNMTTEEMEAIPGIGPKGALAIKAALELGKRMLVSLPQDKVQVRSPADISALLMLDMATLEQEHMKAVLLDTKNFVIAVETVYVGSLNTAVIRTGEVFKQAIRRNAASIIVVHNHPSGDPTPSPEDVRATEVLIEAGKLVDIPVLDHVVIGKNRYVSLKERGLGFK